MLYNKDKKKITGVIRRCVGHYA